MLKTNVELARELGLSIRGRRVGLGWSQVEAAARAGVSYRTWRRMETSGAASIEDCIRAAVALRCEQNLSALFPLPSASSLDELLLGQVRKSRPEGVRMNRRAT